MLKSSFETEEGCREFLAHPENAVGCSRLPGRSSCSRAMPPDGPVRIYCAKMRCGRATELGAGRRLTTACS